MICLHAQMSSHGPGEKLPVLLLNHGTNKSVAFLEHDLGLFERFANQGWLVVGMDCR